LDLALLNLNEALIQLDDALAARIGVNSNLIKRELANIQTRDGSKGEEFWVKLLMVAWMENLPSEIPVENFNRRLEQVVFEGSSEELREEWLQEARYFIGSEFPDAAPSDG
jgi:hypothetical protein